MTQHFFVTGGCGYLGCVLVPELLKRGRVTVVDNLAFGREPIAGFADHPNFRLLVEDTIHLERYREALSDADALIHLSGLSNDPTSDLDPALTIRSNVLSTLALARASREAGVKRFVNMSSCSVYGSQSASVIDEQTPPEPITLYALAKYVCDQELGRLSSHDFAVTSLRLATLFGFSPRMRFDLVVNTMTKTALAGEDLIVHGAGTQYRPFLHVRDAADAILHILKLEPEVVAGEVFNVGNSKYNYRIKDLATEIARHFPGCGVQVLKSAVDHRSYNVDFSRLHERTGFRPERDVSHGVNEIIAKHQAGFFAAFDDPKYYNILTLKAQHREDVTAYSAASVPANVPTTVMENRTAANKKLKVVGMILAHNVGPMLRQAYAKIPPGVLDDVYVMDNSSNDETYEIAKEMGLKVFRNTKRKGYGGNVKEGLLKGLEMGADYIVEIHGDGGQFHPKSIKYALPYMEEGKEFIIGSRFQEPATALKNGMPLIRYAANRFLSTIDRWVLRLPFTEYHTGFRIYSRSMLEKVSFLENSDDYLFSFQIIAQAAYAKCSTAEVPVEADYRGEHTSHELSGAFVYAFQTFHVLGQYTLARRFSLKPAIFGPRSLPSA